MTEVLRQIFDDLVRFQSDLQKEIDTRLRRAAGLRLGGFNVMLFIERTENCRVHDIAVGLSITMGGASHAIARLEKSGLCARTPHPNDRRSVIVQLTPEGRRRVGLGNSAVDEALAARIAGPLADDHLHGLAATLAFLRPAAPVAAPAAAADATVPSSAASPEPG